MSGPIHDPAGFRAREHEFRWMRERGDYDLVILIFNFGNGIADTKVPDGTVLVWVYRSGSRSS